MRSNRGDVAIAVLADYLFGADFMSSLAVFLLPRRLSARSFAAQRYENAFLAPGGANGDSQLFAMMIVVSLLVISLLPGAVSICAVRAAAAVTDGTPPGGAGGGR